MMLTSTIVANRAIQQIGNNTPPVTGVAPTFDNSPAGLALQALYPWAVQTVGRQYGYDFERNTVALSQSGATPPDGYGFSYLYPTNGIEVWQVKPTNADPNNPLPVRWTVANQLVSSVVTKVILTNQANAEAVFANTPQESTWDPLFAQAVVDLLASQLAMALEARPDTSRDMVQQSATFAKLNEDREG